MKLFTKKPKKTEAELKKEREELVKQTSDNISLQLAKLQNKKNKLFNQMMMAKAKGLKDQENNARNLLRQTMASMKRQEGMQMTLELAMDARDLASINSSFMNSMGNIADEIISASKEVKPSKMQAINDKFLRAKFETKKQTDYIDDMIKTGDFSSALEIDGDVYTEYDDEIDSMISEAEMGSAGMNFSSDKLGGF